MAKQGKRYARPTGRGTSKNSGTSTYRCVVCGLPNSIAIKIDKKKSLSRISCTSSSCGVKHETPLGHKGDLVDIYSDWVDGYSDASEQREASRKKEAAERKAKAKAEAEAEAEAAAETSTTEGASLLQLQAPSEIIWTSSLDERARTSRVDEHNDTSISLNLMDLPAEARKRIYYFDTAHYHNQTLFSISGGSAKSRSLKVAQQVAAVKAVLPVKTRKDQILLTTSPLIRVSKALNSEYYGMLREAVSSGRIGVLLQAHNWDFGRAATTLAFLGKQQGQIAEFQQKITPLYLSLNAPGYNISAKYHGPARDGGKQVYYNPDPKSMHSNFEDFLFHVRRDRLSYRIQPVIMSAAHLVRLSEPKDFDVVVDNRGPNQVRYKIQVLTKAWRSHCKSLIVDDSPDRDDQREPPHEFCICRTAEKDLDIQCEHINPVSEEQEQIWAQNQLARDGAEGQVVRERN